MEFQKFSKIPRLSRDITISEKIDGTNAQLFIVKFTPEINKEILISDPIDILVTTDEHYAIFAGSRNRWITPEKDNYGFAKWVKLNSKELLKLGEGHHYGEWYGNGIQRKYDLKEKRFSLFSVKKWARHGEDLIEYKSPNPKEPSKFQKYPPKCCDVVPVLWKGNFDTNEIEKVVEDLKNKGSVAVPGFMNPEGVVILHHASGQLFKKTCVNDEKPKSN